MNGPELTPADAAELQTMRARLCLELARKTVAGHIGNRSLRSIDDFTHYVSGVATAASLYAAQAQDRVIDDPDAIFELQATILRSWGELLLNVARVAENAGRKPDPNTVN